jgi:hypothetical protein
VRIARCGIRSLAVLRRRHILVLQRERRRAHAAAALLHHRQRREEITDLGLAHSEGHVALVDVPGALEVRDAVAVDDHALDGQVGRDDGRPPAAHPSAQARRGQRRPREKTGVHHRRW